MKMSVNTLCIPMSRHLLWPQDGCSLWFLRFYYRTSLLFPWTHNGNLFWCLWHNNGMICFLVTYGLIMGYLLSYYDGMYLLSHLLPYYGTSSWSPIMVSQYDVPESPLWPHNGMGPLIAHDLWHSLWPHELMPSELPINSPGLTIFLLHMVV